MFVLRNVNIRQHMTVKKILMTANFCLKNFVQRNCSLRKVFSSDILQTDRNHGILSEMLFTQFLFAGDCQSVKQRRIGTDLKERTELTHCQRFTKTPRTGEQSDFCTILDDIPDQRGLST